MFGLGMWELIVIAVVALLALGPEKLPGAAKSLSKGIRDFRKQTRELQETLEDDHEIGDAIRDLKSALRGEDINPQARYREQQRRAAREAAAKKTSEATETTAEASASPSDDDKDDLGHDAFGEDAMAHFDAHSGADSEPSERADNSATGEDSAASLIKPAANVVAKEDSSGSGDMPTSAASDLPYATPPELAGSDAATALSGHDETASDEGDSDDESHG